MPRHSERLDSFIGKVRIPARREHDIDRYVIIILEPVTHINPDIEKLWRQVRDIRTVKPSGTPFNIDECRGHRPGWVVPDSVW